MTIKQYLLLICILIFPFASLAQSNIAYFSINAKNIHGKTEDNLTFHRLDTLKHRDLPQHIKRLLTNSAGLFVSFSTNSSSIWAKWCVTSSKAASNLTSIANKGLDLYIKRDGKWLYAGSGKPNATCNEGNLIKNMSNQVKECLLYLPLYDETKSLEIGVEEKASFVLTPNPFAKKILIYGSSILQGASASRPGLAYPAILARNTNFNFINMGLSGSAKMEKDVANTIAAIDADVYVLDCIPNSSAQQIKERTAYLVNSIREKHPQTPIVIIPSSVIGSGSWDQQIATTVKEKNETIKIEYNKLKKAGLKKLYFIDAEDLIGTDNEGTVDGIHPNDLGFSRMLKILEPAVCKILKKEKIKAD